MAKKDAVAPVEQLDRLIYEIGGQKVMLDADLAWVYGVPTKALNQAVKRNADRFPEDFVFQLTRNEFEALERPIADACGRVSNRSRIVTGSQKHRDPRYLPYAFTEHGAIMAANVLSSPRAVQMSVFVVRAFVKMREMLLSKQDMAAKLRELEKKLTERLDTHETAIVEVLREVMLLLNPPDEPPTPREPLGFRVKERRAIYRARGKAAAAAQKSLELSPLLADNMRANTSCTASLYCVKDKRAYHICPKSRKGCC